MSCSDYNINLYNTCGCQKSTCNTCNSCSNNNYYNVPLVPQGCNDCEEDLGCVNVSSECIIYDGEELFCLGVVNGDTYKDILVKIDAVLCGVAPNIDYSGYNTYCLAPITTQQQFVETISQFVCVLREDLDDLTEDFDTFKNVTESRLEDLELPEVTGCSTFPISLGITQGELFQEIIDKDCEQDAFMSLSSVNWSNCITVPVTPLNIGEGFTEILRQLCIIQSTSGDTFKVKLDSTDITENFLANKLKGSGCVTIQQVTDVDSITKLELGLNFEPSFFNFNPSQFEVTPTINDGCLQNYSVNYIGEVEPVTIDCQTISDLFVENPTNLISHVLGKDLDGGCVQVTPCDILNTLWGSNIDGEYTITLNSLSEDCKFELTPYEAPDPGLTYDPNLVDWSACSPCIIENPSPTTLEESFQFLKDEICCITELISNPEGGLKVYYVDGNNPNPGDGSILNPFKTLDSAYNKVVGTGTPKAPENTGIAIEVAASNYTTSLNLFVASTSWNFSTGTIVEYTGTDYLFDTIDTAEYGYFNVSGKWNFNTVNGGLINHLTPTEQSRMSIEINNTEQTMLEEDPLTHPLIKVHSIYGMNAWRRSRLELSVHGKVRSTTNHVLFVDGCTEVYVRGLTAFAAMEAGDGTIYDISPDQRVLYYNNQDPNITSRFMYAQDIRFDSIRVGSDGDSAMFIQGLYGNIDFYNVSFDSLQAVNNFQSSSVEIGNLIKAFYKVTIGGVDINKTRGFTFRNCKFAANIYSGVDPIYAIKSVGVPDTNSISIINSLIPKPYLIDPDLVLNDDLGVMANTITNFNIRNVPEFDNTVDAQTAGLVEGDVYESIIVDVPDTATVAADATPTKDEFDALLAELRALKASIQAGSNNLRIV